MRPTWWWGLVVVVVVLLSGCGSPPPPEPEPLPPGTLSPNVAAQRVIDDVIGRPCDVLTPEQFRLLGISNVQGTDPVTPGGDIPSCIGDRARAGGDPDGVAIEFVRIDPYSAALAEAQTFVEHSYTVTAVDDLPAVQIFRLDDPSPCEYAVLTAANAGLKVRMTRYPSEFAPDDACALQLRLAEEVVRSLPRANA